MSLISRNFTTRYMNEQAEGGEPAAEAESSPDVNQLMQELESLRGEKEAMKNKMEQLLGETKKAKQLRREEEERARMLAEEKAKKEGDFEQLFKSQQQQAEQYKTELEALRGTIAKEKEQGTAMKLAAELADGANAEILSEFIARRLKFTDEGIKVLSNNGELTVSTLDQLKSEFQGDAKYSSLLKGSQASGGSASGGSTSSATDKVMTRSEFDALRADKKSAFVKDGGKIVD